MSDKTVQMKPGEALVHLKLNGGFDIHLTGQSESDEVGEVTLLALGLGLVLDNDEWVYKLKARMAMKIGEMKDEVERGG